MTIVNRKEVRSRLGKKILKQIRSAADDGTGCRDTVVIYRHPVLYRIVLYTGPGIKDGNLTERANSIGRII